MKKFFRENKIVLATVAGALIIGLIIGGAILISNQRKNFSNEMEVGVENCADIPKLSDRASRLVTEIIDGDTFLIEGGYSVRILGVDADERNHFCYKAAKDRLEEMVLGREVRLKKGNRDMDQWCRYLRYVFLNGQNIGLELVKDGLVIARFSPGDVKYRDEIAQAEKGARENKIGCKWEERGHEKEAERGGEIEFLWQKLTPELTDLKIVNACQAEAYLNREIIIEGKIVDTYRHLRSNTVFLNFEKPFPKQCFTGVIFDSNLYKFVQNPEDYYLNKIVRIKGIIKEHKNRPQIILENPFQIEIGD